MWGKSGGGAVQGPHGGGGGGQGDGGPYLVSHLPIWYAIPLSGIPSPISGIPSLLSGISSPIWYPISPILVSHLINESPNWNFSLLDISTITDPTEITTNIILKTIVENAKQYVVKILFHYWVVSTLSPSASTPSGTPAPPSSSHSICPLLPPLAEMGATPPSWDVRFNVHFNLTLHGFNLILHASLYVK